MRDANGDQHGYEAVAVHLLIAFGLNLRVRFTIQSRKSDCVLYSLFCSILLHFWWASCHETILPT